ncbi:hypothetical protein A3A71_01550 [Candidatus Berkelbacteria bacterium RIFCSPLOWO2_01_FULL_50_28]|uniref:Uncharacterized protein n=1 Tax=Candidatus Berkelbacteria bacterium RIFCSPLOWO2_01_FULL_50_28 TaxID=1797471 RepID=A0A1F5EBP7_9BACT|nr:MAG: hypothetical protein A3A71_01550 [Candidatus Berkelbacteria bacterium RIFCSPLOWO2_01_FULL_50_28]
MAGKSDNDKGSPTEPGCILAIVLMVALGIVLWYFLMGPGKADTRESTTEPSPVASPSNASAEE